MSVGPACLIPTTDKGASSPFHGSPGLCALHPHQRWKLLPAHLSHECPQEPAPHTGAFDSHLSAVRSLGGQRGSARGSFYPPPNLITLVYWGHRAPLDNASINSPTGHQGHFGCHHPVSQSLGDCPICTCPGSLRKASPAITFYIDTCFISGDGVGWECHPCLNTVPNLIDFYTEVQLHIAQVAFMYLYKIILKRFKEHPFCILVCPLPLLQLVALVLVRTSLCTEGLGWGNNLYLILFLSTVSWEQLCDDFCNLTAPGTVFKLLYFQTLPYCPGQRALHRELV